MIGRVLGAWVHDLDPVAIHFPASWGLRGVHWYGLAYAAGFLAAAWLLGRWRRQGLAPARQAADESTLVTAVMIGVLAGGRLGHVLLYARDEFAADPFMVFQVWKGGMASHGGFLGVVLAGLWYARTRGVPFLAVGDLLCALAPAGIFFGRLANFVNAELVGRTTDVPWAVIFPHEGLSPRHPSQLYEAFGEGLLPLVWVLVRYPRRLAPGRLAGEFLLLYAVARIVCEAFREAEDGHILGLTAGQFWTLPLAAAGLWLVWRARRTAE
ncbi:prolipoprotein diacylglyceryl transferase [Opitutia bacterium]|jgi:phosphatidylglycerol:prolipoprotein diacylglycerol transferase|nr:prolipoprotein diacylglyceryl transferase [Opitutae bacterium]